MLSSMTLRNMSEFGLTLRHLGDNANNMEDVSNNIIQYLYEHLIDKLSGEKSCILIRFFKTLSYGELTPELQEHTRTLLDNDVLTNNLKCLILLATAGELPEWNSRHQSVGHKVIPLSSEEAIARIPMIYRLIQQLGLDPGTIVQPNFNPSTDLEQRMYNVFYIPNALGNPDIPSQTSFVIPFNVKSVIGFGGILPSGNMFVIVMFLKIVVPRFIVDLFRPLALNVKMAILPFDDGRVFSHQSQGFVKSTIATRTNQDDILRLNSQIATLTQLLDVSEQETITQSDRLEKANTHLQKTLDKLQNHLELFHAEKMSSLGQLVAGVAHEINNPLSFVYSNLVPAMEYTQDLLGLLELYEKHYNNPSEEIKKEIKKIELDFLKQDLIRLFSSMEEGTERIRKIVLSVRNFSRLDEAELKWVNIHEGIDSTLMILHSRLKATHDCPGIEVVKEYGQLPFIECFPSQLNQVFMNIVANAIDALDDKNSKCIPKDNKANPNQIRICTEVIDKNWIEILIADNGPGIPEEIHSKLFDPFFTTKEVGKGTGLGLSISYQIVVNKHGGELSCFSTVGQGTEFIIKIPINQNHLHD
ncbi:MAG: HAMP domain-containing histidine kinase [Stigonema ocellatum SAG 48.90 = DSM 106950]|nr:HAMP domain-containing histidine kinase [Stigonema ocellatum SAG 48.90 = DSM 106950]